MARHGLFLVLLDVGIVRVAGRGDRGLCPLFWDFLRGTERWSGTGNAQPPIETGKAVGNKRMRVFTGVRGLERRQRSGW